MDVVVTQRGIAVNPKQKELKERLLKAGLPVKDIEELKQIAEDIAGVVAITAIQAQIINQK